MYLNLNTPHFANWYNSAENPDKNLVRAMGLISKRLILEKKYQGHFVSIPQFNNLNEEQSDKLMSGLKKIAALYSGFKVFNAMQVDYLLS